MKNEMNRRTERVHLVCTPQMRELMERIGLTLDMSISEVIREAIRQYAEQKGIS